MTDVQLVVKTKDPRIASTITLKGVDTSQGIAQVIDTTMYGLIIPGMQTGLGSSQVAKTYTSLFVSCNSVSAVGTLKVKLFTASASQVVNLPITKGPLSFTSAINLTCLAGETVHAKVMGVPSGTLTDLKLHI